MHQLLGKFTKKFNTLSLRERGVISVMCAVIIIATLDSIFFEPLFSRKQVFEQKLAQMEEESQSLQSSMMAQIENASNNSNSTVKSRLATLKQQLNELDVFLKIEQQQFIQPDQMVQILETMLIKNRKLQLVALNNLPIQPLADKTSSSDQSDLSAQAIDETEALIYKHSVEIKVQGKYLDLLEYIADLESISARIFWERANLRVENYPIATLILTVYTLSLDKTWLKV